MTPDRWREVGALFDAAVQIEPARRELWLRDACGLDDELRIEVGRLLAEDERAERGGFLTPPEKADPSAVRTGSWLPRGADPPSKENGAVAPAKGQPVDDLDGFTPRAAIASDPGRPPISEPPAVVRSRLREVPIVPILILIAAALWRRAVLGEEEPTLYRVDAGMIGILVGIIALLWSRCPIPLVGLKVLELAMVGLLAGRIALVQYRLMLGFSLRGDVMMAQLTLKNVVLLTSVMILTFGLYVPKSWRRAALVVGPLALLPLATLAVLAVQYPLATGWLWEGWHHSTTPRAYLFVFDALVLLILAVGSAYGARTISRLRGQVAEARRLGQYCLGPRLGGGGMGEVYLAEHQLLKRPCAVKLIRPGPEIGPKALERF
jgi:serine/threonine-protein kinase